MLAFILEHRQIIGVAILSLWALLQFKPSLNIALARLRTGWTSPAPSPTADDDAADFQALSRLRKRFERNKCKDGQNAVDVCLSHFFHKDG